METTETLVINDKKNLKENRNKIFTYIEDICKTKLTDKESKVSMQNCSLNTNSLLFYYGNLLITDLKAS